MIVSVDSVSENFRLYNPESEEWLSKDLLTEFVNFWKIIFVEKNNLKSGDKIGLGFPLTDIYYFGALYAAAELGLKLVVLDISNHTQHFSKNLSQIQDFLPLDLFVSGKMLIPEKHNYYQSLSQQTEYWHLWDQYQIKNNELWQSITQQLPDPGNVLLLCTSSGTTDRPKKVQHSHKFLYDISQRNKDLFEFKGNVLHVRNLHHGSSLAVYFLPSLMSDHCTGHYVFNYEQESHIEELAKFCCQHNINHLQFPYTHAVENFLNYAVKNHMVFDNLTLYTLSYINPDWQVLVQKCGIKQIISIFGCNETSGPLFINTLYPDSVDFDPKDFVKPDNFYDYSFNDTGQLLVYLKQYDRTIVMQDSFEHVDGQYQHLGRNDLVRINDTQVDFFWLLELCRVQQISGQIILDRQREKLYLAVWDDTDPNGLSEKLNVLLKDKYGPNVQISQSKNLCYQDHLMGIKLDHESLRNVFRKSNYGQTSTP
jgi:hypothetical protein